MKSPLTSPADLAPPPPRHLTPSQRVACWLELMKTSERFLIGSLRRSARSPGELEESVRRWYEREMADHDRMIVRLASRMGGLRDGDDR